jgi:hypothetical protein
MNPQLKTVVLLEPATTPTNAATSTARLDTLGFDWATIDVVMGTSNATTKPTTLKISEGDGTVAASASDITKFVGGGAGGFTIPAMDTAAATTVKFNIDLRPRKRYLFVTLAPASVHNTAVIANLAKGEKAPITATLAGVNALVEG